MLGWWDIRAVDAKRGRMVRAPVDGLEGRLGSSGGGHYYYVGRGVGGYYVRREGGGTIRRGRGAVKWQVCVTRPARDELSPTKHF